MADITKDNHQKILVITINHSNAGLFAYVNFAINQLIYAEKHNLLPVVYFGPRSGNGDNAYYDARYGANMWDYYFEPVAGLTYSDIEERLADTRNLLTSEDLVTLTEQDLWQIHNQEPDSVYPYPHGIYLDTYKDDPDWYAKQRRKAHEIISKYIRVKPHIIEKVDTFAREHFAGNKVIGVHMRGTDKGTARLTPELMKIVKPSEYFSYIDEYTKRHGECKIFVATDQKQFLQQMRSRYGDRVLSRDTVRVSGLRNAFQLAGDGYRKGEEVLIDCLLLSRTDYLLKCTSAVGEFALYLNKDLPSVDLNHSIGALTGIQSYLLDLRQRAWQHYHHMDALRRRTNSNWLTTIFRYVFR